MAKTQLAAIAAINPILRRPVVQEATGITSRSTLYRRIKEGLFTKPVVLATDKNRDPCHGFRQHRCRRDFPGRSPKRYRDRQQQRPRQTTGRDHAGRQAGIASPDRRLGNRLHRLVIRLKTQTDRKPYQSPARRRRDRRQGGQRRFGRRPRKPAKRAGRQTRHQAGHPDEWRPGGGRLG